MALRGFFVLVILALVGFPLAVAGTAVSKGWFPPIAREIRCRGYWQWVDDTNTRLDRARSLIDFVNTTSRPRTYWSNAESLLLTMAHEQEHSDVPPELEDVNSTIVDIFQINADMANANSRFDSEAYSLAKESHSTWSANQTMMLEEISTTCDLW